MKNVRRYRNPFQNAAGLPAIENVGPKPSLPFTARAVSELAGFIAIDKADSQAAVVRLRRNFLGIREDPIEVARIAKASDL